MGPKGSVEPGSVASSGAVEASPSLSTTGGAASAELELDSSRVVPSRQWPAWQRCSVLRSAQSASAAQDTSQIRAARGAAGPELGVPPHSPTSTSRQLADGERLWQSA